MIQAAIKARQPRMELEGTTTEVDANAGIFVTMNPAGKGYGGRSKLPDNLKALFRAVAMSAPNNEMIAEVMLAAEGFREAKPLSKKTITLYNLMIQQLSKQDHYDFGMRAVNTVIQAAGILKKNEGPDAAEDLLMLRAIRDSNLSKFLKNDVVLFGSIIKDLFPGVAEPKVEYAALEKELLDVTKESGLQPAPEFLVKCIQLYEMTVVRHGMMLVGPTGGGKSRILRTLQAAMSRVKDDPAFERVRVYRCNPKAISMNQLYGAFDEQTGEWTDGIAAVLIRHISQPNLEETGVTDANIKWMAFDGPVDAV